MSHHRCQHYLEALGITLWLPRQPESPPPSSVTMAIDPTTVALDALEQRIEAISDFTAAADQATEEEWLTTMADDELQADSDDSEHAPVAFTEDRAGHIANLDWQALIDSVRQCTACSLCDSRTQTVFGVGNRKADWLIVGEAPGADEDRQGEPFVGRAGKLLNPMLQAIGLDRDQVFIANILKCRPPDNRDPTPTEAESCRPFLERQIVLIQPRLILAVGRIAAQNLLATDTQIGKLRSRIHYFGPTCIPVVVTYHPAYLLRSPREKRKAWDDLRLARRMLTAVANK